MKEKTELRPARLIPCLLMPLLTAACFLLCRYTGLVVGILTGLFPEADGIPFALLFAGVPIFSMIAGILPALLLNRKEKRVWQIWAVLFYAVFFAVYVFTANGPFFRLWLFLAASNTLFHILPDGMISCAQAAIFRCPS